MSEFLSPESRSPRVDPVLTTEASVPERSRERSDSARRLLRELAETLLLAALIFLAIRSVVQNFRVEGQSMEPNLTSGQYLLINKAIYTRINLHTVDKLIPFFDFTAANETGHYLFRQPQQGDIVVFRFPQQPSRDFIKRIIAVPGDTIEIRDGTVLVNGVHLDEPYVERQGHYSFGPAVVPPRHYFVLGDNRPLSYDSRAWGFVPEENILGKAWISYWPISAWGFIPSHPAVARVRPAD